MEKQTTSQKTRLIILTIIFLVLIFGLSYILTSCSSAYAPHRHSITDGCGMSKGMVGYGPGGYHGKNQ